MAASTNRTLADQLGPDLPEGVDALPEEHKQALANAVREARRRQSRELATSSEQALKYVPALLRPAVRKAVGL